MASIFLSYYIYYLTVTPEVIAHSAILIVIATVACGVLLIIIYKFNDVSVIVMFRLSATLLLIIGLTILSSSQERDHPHSTFKGCYEAAMPESECR